MTRLRLSSAAAVFVITMSVPCMIAAADSIPVVPPEPEQAGDSNGPKPAPASEDAVSKSVVDDPGAEILRLRQLIGSHREEIESSRSADLDQVDDAYRSRLASIDPKDMFETDAEHREREAREKSEARLDKARSESEVNRKYDDLLSEDVEPLFQRARALLDEADVVPPDAVAVHLEKYDPEHGIFVGGLETDSDLIGMKARLVVPMKREAARTFWKNKDSVVGRMSLSMDVYSLDIEIEDFWLEDPQSASRTEERIAVLEVVSPPEAVSPSEEQRRRADGLRVSASSLAKRAAEKEFYTGYNYDNWAKGVIAEYNRLVGEAKAVFANNPHVQALKPLANSGSISQVRGAVETAARSLESYFSSFTSSMAFKTAAAALAKRATEKEFYTGYNYDDWAKGVIAEYNRLVGEAKAVFANDPHVQALKPLVDSGSRSQVRGAVETAARSLESYFSSFSAHTAFKTAASALAERATEKEFYTGYNYDDWAKGVIAEYNRLVGEAKAVFANDPHVQALKPLVDSGSRSQVRGAVETAARSLESYFSSFSAHTAFKTAASALAERAAEKQFSIGYNYDDWAKGVIAEYNRLVGEAKAVFTNDPHVQALKPLVDSGSRSQVRGAVETAAWSLESYFFSFSAHTAFKTAASALAERAAEKQFSIGYNYDDWAKGVIAEYNRLVGEAKAVFANDPHVQGLKTLSYTGSNSQAAGAVTTAARTFERAMEDVEEAPRDIAAEAVADAAPPSPRFTLLDHLPYSGRFSSNAIKLAELLGRWFSPDASDENGWTDLHYAAALNLPGLASALLEAGADPDSRLKSDGGPFGGGVPGTLSAFGRNIGGDDLGDWHRNGHTPMHFAAWFNADLAAPHLIAGGAETDPQSNNGSTPLSFAAWENSRTVAEFLIGRGADVQVASRSGWTPMDYALYRKSSDTAALLRRHGGQCNKACQ